MIDDGDKSHDGATNVDDHDDGNVACIQLVLSPGQY